ncbi:MAG: fumarylacetoacetate hydrolase family protein [Candidatus Solibacter usitatus]|nr:fumarylacetoacetate hydrolase family protein [Candidatus Solibacter usitatus]
MRYITFENAAGARQPGVLRNGDVIGLSKAGFDDLLDVIRGGAEARRRVDEFAALPPGDAVYALSAVRICAPLPHPPKFICVGLNYRDHAEEVGAKIPDVPTIFNKFPTTIIAPGDNIILPSISSQPDYEAEFAFVIGTGGRKIAACNWKDHVFGYTMVNDVSARDFQRATTQWLMGKTFDTFGPMGPAIVTADEIEDPHALDITMTINGEVMQKSNTRNLIFDIPKLLEFLSSVFTLQPGDVVSTGTPGGVGSARKPPRYLRHGDECVVEVQGLGQLRNPVVAES